MEADLSKLTGLSRHTYDCAIRLNRAFEKMQTEVKRVRAEGVDDRDLLVAIDAAADTSERKAAQAQVEKVLAQTTPPPPKARTEQIAEDIVAGRRPVR